MVSNNNNRPNFKLVIFNIQIKNINDNLLSNMKNFTSLLESRQ